MDYYTTVPMPKSSGGFVVRAAFGRSRLKSLARTQIFLFIPALIAKQNAYIRLLLP